MILGIKKYVLKLLGLVLLTALTTHCKKIEEGTDLYFYTATMHQGAFKLYINEKEKGEVPVFITSLSAKNDTILCKSLHLKLPSGEYKLQVKDENGKLNYLGLLKLHHNHYTGTTEFGHLDHATADGKLIIRFGFNQTMR